MIETQAQLWSVAQSRACRCRAVMRSVSRPKSPTKTRSDSTAIWGSFRRNGSLGNNFVQDNERAFFTLH